MLVTKHHIWRGIAAVSVLVALALPPAVSAAAQSTGVRVQSCTSGDSSTARAVTFRVTVTTRRGADRMAAKVTLVRQPKIGTSTTASTTPKRISIKSWSGWVRSRSGRSALILTRRVDGLTGPAEYHAEAQLRWYDKRGKRIASRTVRSAKCTQPGYGPDLVVGALPAVPVPPDTVLPAHTGASVTVAVRNDGAYASRAAKLEISAPSGVVGSATVPSVAPGQSIAVDVTISGCSGGEPLTATIISDSEDYESSYSNNSAQVGTCQG
jgi:hypothetical protein